MTLIALLLLMLWPPAVGRLLLIPLADQNTGRVVNIALDGGAALLGPGPVPGSMIVVGERARIAHQIRAANLLMLAAPTAGCGDVEQPI